MNKILGLAFRNLTRLRRRSLLTGLLIALGVTAVIVFDGLSGSFQRLVVGQITDSMLSHLQIHRKGYVASIDNLPLNLNFMPPAYGKLKAALEAQPAVEAFAPRLKLGAMLSNYNTTTTIRLNGVDPEREARVVPDLKNRIKGRTAPGLLAEGEVLIPEILAKGLELKIGDTVVVVATNKDGSVNGLTLKVGGVVESMMGPGGRDGYMHIKDAANLLRMADPEISEVAVRVKNFDRLGRAVAALETALGGIRNPKGHPMFELHTWADLSPFASIARIIQLMTVFIKVILIAVVLISILNVMMMSVYERIREIGALSAIGASPGKIMALFLAEGLILAMLSALAGAVLGGGLLFALGLKGITFTFGRQVFTVMPAVDLGQAALVCLIVVASAALAGLQPAAKASRLDPVEALRHV